MPLLALPLFDTAATMGRVGEFLTLGVVCGALVAWMKRS